MLARAPDQSTAQLRAALAKAILAVGPEGRTGGTGEPARIAGAAGPAADGMATLWALLSAPDARSAWSG